MVVEIVAPVEGEDDVQRVDIFTLEGVTYSIPDKVRPNVSMKYLWLIRTRGPGAAETWLGEELLGTKAYEALVNCNYLTQEQSDEIFRSARIVVFGERRPKSPQENQTTTSGTPEAQPTTTKRSNGQRTAKRPSKATSQSSTGSKIAGKG